MITEFGMSVMCEVRGWLTKCALEVAPRGKENVLRLADIQATIKNYRGRTRFDCSVCSFNARVAFGHEARLWTGIQEHGNRCLVARQTRSSRLIARQSTSTRLQRRKRKFNIPFHINVWLNYPPAELPQRWIDQRVRISE